MIQWDSGAAPGKQVTWYKDFEIVLFPVIWVKKELVSLCLKMTLDYYPIVFSVSVVFLIYHQSLSNKYYVIITISPILVFYHILFFSSVRCNFLCSIFIWSLMRM